MVTYTANIKINSIGRRLYPFDIDAKVDGRGMSFGTCGATPSDTVEDIERMIREQYGDCQARSIRYALDVKAMKDIEAHHT